MLAFADKIVNLVPRTKNQRTRVELRTQLSNKQAAVIKVEAAGGWKNDGIPRITITSSRGAPELTLDELKEIVARAEELVPHL